MPVSDILRSLFGLDYMESSGNIRFINAGCVTEAFAPGRKLGLEYIGWSKISGMPVVFLGILILTNGWIIKEMTVMPSLAVEFITLIRMMANLTYRGCFEFPYSGCDERWG